MTDSADKTEVYGISNVMAAEGSDELKIAIISAITEKEGRSSELEKLKQQNAMDIKKGRSLFWVSSSFIGLCTAVLTLILGEFLGVVRLGAVQNHALLISERQFERDMIQEAISENDPEARIDALRLLVKADLLSGLTEGELTDYEKSIGDRSVPNIATSSQLEYSIIEEDIERVEVIGFPGKIELVRVPTPFPMKLDWSVETEINTIRFHKYGACALSRALTRIFQHYGDDVHTLGISRFSGGFVNRKLRGSDRPSIHAYGVAIDLFASGNPFGSKPPEAKFSKPEYHQMLKIFSDEGFVNQGNRALPEWMEFQLSLDVIRTQEEPSDCGLTL
ncbi:M15 family metallopeptidase [Pseudophaeobacter sp.]|uniref:M15 family metallopeptidase n=1 Tax=Pseudophaeobacter sp. TaxID=1971739 RepID=UPI003296C99F